MTSTAPTSPAVSVVMPVCNGEKYLRPAIDSILAQTLRDFELIIVDDASTDSTPEILEEYRQRDPRVRVIRNERRLRQGHTLNVGIAAARAPLLVVHDADDFSAPNRLEKQKAFLDAHPDFAVVASSHVIVDEAGARVAEIPLPGDGDVLVELMPRRCSFIHCAAMFRTAAVREIGGYRGGFELSQDYDFLMRFTQANRVGTLPEPFYFYRRGAASKSVRVREAQQRSGELVRQFAAERAATGRDSYDEYLARGMIPQFPKNIPPGERSRYYYILSRIAVGQGEYRTALRYLWRGIRRHPSLLPRAAYLLFAMCIRIILGMVGLLKWFERKFRAK